MTTSFSVFSVVNSLKFDLVFCLGDRFEMSAAVQAGIPFNVKFAHLHGGETTLGAIDNIYRHQITLASNLHFTAGELFSDRVIELIGNNKNVYTVGSLSLNEIEKLKPLIGDIILGYDEDETIEVVLARLLSEKQLTLATAESCTGGKIAQLMSAVPGASACFKGGIVAYSNQIKIDVLKVNLDTIRQFSVVSNEVAKEMAQNVKKIMNTDYAIATTGNAGPSKGDSKAEIGTVFIALATPQEVVIQEFNFGQPRDKVIDRAVNKGLEMLLKEILKNY